MFDRNFEILRHACRQSRRLRVDAKHPLVLGGEARKGLGWVAIQRRNSHQPDQRQCFGSRHLAAQLIDAV